MNQHNDLEKCILVGFPNTSDDIRDLNYCILFTKYYIFIQWLFSNNELDLYVCQTQIKLALNIEHNICKKRNEHQKFIKFSHIYETF